MADVAVAKLRESGRPEPAWPMSGFDVGVDDSKQESTGKSFQAFASFEGIPF